MVKELKVKLTVGSKKFDSEISYDENRVSLKDLRVIFKEVKPIELQEQKIHPKLLKAIMDK